ncbi:MAG: insulinase family protein [Bacteroidetes bacterium]|nr:insulinase family protein [Bacteroidota bacterium]
MIHYSRFVLKNGLTVIHHLDENSQLAVLNLLYKVGSKEEDPNKTGFAHLFEHLMFGGTPNITEFDEPLQEAGGDSNAFTSNDITNYYLSLPLSNIETGFWLESDRMRGLAFSQKSLDVQKGVVIEEFKERYLNQPYGDIWLRILPLAYKEHPYSWPTIGKEISHIEEANMDQVKSFFKNFYAPNNCILVVAGNISLERVKELCSIYFEDIPAQEIKRINYPQESVQTEARFQEIQSDVPSNLILKAWHMGDRLSQNYYAMDLLSDILGSGKGSRLYDELVKKQAIFSEIDAYISGDAEPGLFLIEGKLLPETSFHQAENAIKGVLDEFFRTGCTDRELTMVQNKTETNIRFGDVNLLNRAMKLAFAEYLGDIELTNKEINLYLDITKEILLSEAKRTLVDTNCSTIHYKSSSND